jgi:predicted flap endonuclease-1-like 5' DNA nuclease
MTGRSILQAVRAWPGSTWFKAAAAGLLACLICLALGLWTLLAILVGIVVFVLVVWLLRGVGEHNVIVSGVDRVLGSAPGADHGGGTAAAEAPTAAEPVPPAAAFAAPVPPEPAAEPAPVPEARPAAPAEPEAAAAEDAPGVGQKPELLDGPREGVADDLKRIKGIGEKLEASLNAHGVYHFDQIAAWTDDEVAWVDESLEGFKGRCTRDDWVGQARLLAGGGETEFSQRVDRGEVYE